MNWTNVRLIFLREVRDQLRDRRTLFTIAILPLLLYPLLGMTLLQVSQFTHERPVWIGVVGMEGLPAEPALLAEERFAAAWCSPDEARLLRVRSVEGWLPTVDDEQRVAAARDHMERGEYVAIVHVPDGFREALAHFRQTRASQATAAGERPERQVREETAALPAPQVLFNAADDRSRITGARVGRVLSNWRREIVRQYLVAQDLPAVVTEPFEIREVDVSREASRRAAFWSKVLPFVVFVWALTGAFYPAVDVCAGEKERGTLETLLSSPAQRSEIVLGKLLTVIGFSSATSLLNLISLTLTGTAVIIMQPAVFPVGPPPLAALGWLLLALLPISALFSALALAIAAFARSTKEGQYYLIPLLLVSMPLMMLPLLPAVELQGGTSLIPITGLMLLLRGLVEGQYVESLWYVPSVLLVTGGCCLLAIRWAVDQFNNESVLFRESERLDVALWLRHVFRNRGATPTFAQAIGCGAILLTIRFFSTFAVEPPSTWGEFARLQLASLVLFVALPAVALTLLLTRSPVETLLLKASRGAPLALTVLLAITLHPVAMLVNQGVQWLYPINDEMLGQLAGIQSMLQTAPSLWHVLALMALAPAICEELAFRGFILSGLRHMGSKWGAIFISSLLFGVTHGILQQSISATLVGMVIGYLAIQTGSLLPCVAFHLVYNTLSLTAVTGRWATPEAGSWWGWLVHVDGAGLTYRWPVVAIAIVASSLLLAWFRRLPHGTTPEEALHEALSHQSARSVTT
jgi:sodium transport system permease protein